MHRKAQRCQAIRLAVAATAPSHRSPRRPLDTRSSPAPADEFGDRRDQPASATRRRRSAGHRAGARVGAGPTSMRSTCRELPRSLYLVLRRPHGNSCNILGIASTCFRISSCVAIGEDSGYSRKDNNGFYLHLVLHDTPRHSRQRRGSGIGGVTSGGDPASPPRPRPSRRRALPGTAVRDRSRRIRARHTLGRLGDHALSVHRIPRAR